ncbi:hypothetical protein HR12_32535 [Microbacterium sp. SUBG005]|nr:hypothetical protein HR12_32535 [Microbacterium sp. SUBG005]
MTQSPPLGVPATVGVRIGAFSVDAALVVIAAGAASLLGSPVLGAAVAAEALLGLWILQARRGFGPGALLFGLRTSRAEALLVPGAVEPSCAGLSCCSAGWCWSPGPGSWSRPPPSTAPVYVDPGPIVRPAPYSSSLPGDARIRMPTARPGSPEPTVHARPAAGREPLQVSAAAAALPTAPAWDTPLLAVEAPAVVDAPAAAGERAPAATPAARAPEEPILTGGVGRAQLLVVFDTGQREQIDLPAAVNFGRAPVATEPGDVLIAVDDPDRLISKTHLRLEHDGETAWVVDTGSTNGSELIDDDGAVHPLQPGARTLLEDGTRVRLSERVFTLSRLIGGPV